MGQVTIVFGLGNPGAQYKATRHNLGFWVVDRLAVRHGVRLAPGAELGRKADWGELEVPTGTVVLARPRTYMNRSGRAAAALCEHFRVGVERLVVVHDDADLALGRLRIRRGGGAGGHNGVRSIIDALREREFVRVRLGVRGAERTERDLADYVLEPFQPDEHELAEDLAELGADAVEAVIAEGPGPAMNRFNGLARGTASGPEEREEREER